MLRPLRAVKNAARLCGVSIGRHPPKLSLERHLKKLLRLYEIGLVIDVGAHHGEFARMLRKDCSYRGRIVSFEPATEAFTRMSSFKDENWDHIKAGLGSTSGEEVLNLFAISKLNSIYGSSELGRRVLPREFEERGTEAITVMRLDEATEKLDISVHSQPTMIKVDTQGNEFEVLAGGPRAVSAARILQIEIPVLPLYDRTPDFISCLSDVLDRGYQLTGMFPMGRDRHMRLRAFDCVLVQAPPESSP